MLSQPRCNGRRSQTRCDDATRERNGAKSRDCCRLGGTLGITCYQGGLSGVLGGPLGVLLGFGLGAAGGALVDASRSDDLDDAITEFGKTVRPGGNAIIAQTDEADTAALDALVTKYDGAIVRRPLDEVLAELEAQQDAAEAAAEAARKKLHDEKKAEKKEKREERVEKLKAKFS